MADTGTTKNKKKRQLKRPKLLIAAGIVLIVIAAIVLWYRYNQAPAEGTIHNQDSSSVQPEVSTANLTYNGKSVGFSYPGIYTNQQKGTPTGIITEQIAFIGRIGSQETRKIGLTVKQQQAGIVLKEDATYTSRLGDKANYTHTTAIVASKTAEVFTRKDGTEITFIIPGNGNYAVISGTTTNPTGLLSDDVDTIIKSFKWQ